MKRLLFVCAVASLLMVVGSMVWAGITKSQSNTYRLVYDTTAVSPAQAAAVLKELDKLPSAPQETTVRMFLQKQGVNLSLVKKISIIQPGQRRKSGSVIVLDKRPLILLLTNPADEPAAIAVGDEGAPADKPKKPTK